MWGGSKDVGKGVPFTVGEGAQLKVGETMTNGHGDSVPFWSFTVGGEAGHGGGLIMDVPAKVLHLARGQDGFAVRHVSTIVEDKDDGAEAGVDIGPSLTKAQVAHGVIVDAVEVDGAVEKVDGAHVGADDGPVGTTVHEGTPAFPKVSGINTHGVGVVNLDTLRVLITRKARSRQEGLLSSS
jgi:hypothetical protein